MKNAQPTRPRLARALVPALLGTSVLVIVGAALLLVFSRHSAAQPGASAIRPTGIPAALSTRTADLMGVSPVPAKSAPAWRLTDQHGHVISLSSFRGRAVVLEFMDSHCTDICPLVSEEFVDANRYLGAAASKVVFLAVNVNLYHASVKDMLSYSREHQLVSIPSWHFVTGPTAELKSVWRAYGIEVRAPNPNTDIIHTSAIYFIDPSGHERYLASPMADHTASGKAYLPAADIIAWGHGIAILAKQLAP